MSRLILALTIVVCLISAPTFAALVLTQGDGATPAIYTNGGGTGFGGTLGNGSITMDVVGTNLNVGVLPAGSLDTNVVALFLDTRSGGFLDADMDDQADGGRRAISNLTSTQNDVYPSGVLPDFGVAFGSFGTVLFELNAGNTPGHLNFLQFDPAVGSISIPLATLGNPIKVDFFSGYVGDSGYNSNESLPYSVPLNSNGNPGFGDGQFGGLTTGGTYENFNRFVTTAIPEASTVFVWSLVLVSAAMVRRRFNNIAKSGPRAA